MKGLVKYGVLGLFLLAVIALLVAPQSIDASGGVFGVNISVTSVSPANDSVFSTQWMDIVFVFNTTVDTCLIQVGNWTPSKTYLNVSGVVTNNTANTISTCTFNITKTFDNKPSQLFNFTVFANDTNREAYWTDVYTYRVDTTAPILNNTKRFRYNNTFTLSGEITDNHLQDYLNVTFDIQDNTTRYMSCGIVVEQDIISSDGTTRTQTYYNNLTNTSDNFHMDGTDLVFKRSAWGVLTADDISDGTYQGMFWVYPRCVDVAGNVGVGARMAGVINPILSARWTPISSIVGVAHGDAWAPSNLDHNVGPKMNTPINFSFIQIMGNDGQANPIGWSENLTSHRFLWNTSYMGNISWVAVVRNNTFILHNFNQSTNNWTPINLTNWGSMYLYSTNGWNMIRLNYTTLESIPPPIDTGYGAAAASLILQYNSPGGNLTGNWNCVPNFRSNITLNIINTSKTCGNITQQIAWFNALDTRCAKGCWVGPYDNEFNYVSERMENESVVPIGTPYWLLNKKWKSTGTQNNMVNMTTIPTSIIAGICAVGHPL